jgi:hypothetical protein
MKLRVLMASALMYLLVLISPAYALEPGWSSVVASRGTRHKQLQSTPILCRPYRPFHVYGNTVRRIHYRGSPLPQRRDFVQGSAALLRGR